MTELLNECTVEGNVIKVPTRQLDRKTYVKLQKAIVDIGGKWKGGKVFGFVFDEDPSGLLASIQGGDKINLKQDYQFFETPDELADQLVELSGVNEFHKTLEPSAGRGAIIRAIQRKIGNISNVCATEIMDSNRNILGKNFPDVKLAGIKNFLDFASNMQPQAHSIIANPPFKNNQDIDHIYKMYEMLLPGGRLVSIVSTHWQISDNKKETMFRLWLDEVDATIIPVDRGAFKASGTVVPTNIIVINKSK